jgi:hypothetical protein
MSYIFPSPERTKTRVTRPFGSGPFIAKKISWIGDSITQAGLGTVENNERSSFPHMVSNYFGAQCSNIAAGSRTLSSFMSVTQSSADPIGSGDYVGQWYKNTTSGNEFFWNGTTWQQRKAGQSGTWFVGDRRALWDADLADPDVEIMVIAMSATNDIRAWFEGTGGVKDEHSAWHFRKELEQLVKECYAVGKTVVFMFGHRALDTATHGVSPDAPTSLISPERLANYVNVYREVADANNITCVDIQFLFHSEFTHGRTDINMRSFAGIAPTGFSLIQWQALNTGYTDYEINKDEFRDHYYANAGNGTLGRSNQHPNEWGSFVMTCEFIRTVYEFGI